jgi:hypothetical protein
MTIEDNTPQPPQPAEPATPRPEPPTPRPEPPTLPPPDQTLIDTLTEGVDPDRPIRIERSGG